MFEKDDEFFLSKESSPATLLSSPFIHAKVGYKMSSQASASVCVGIIQPVHHQELLLLAINRDYQNAIPFVHVGSMKTDQRQQNCSSDQALIFRWSKVTFV